MNPKNSLWFASLAAFLLGVPMAEKASAQDAGEIVDSSFSLFFGIVDAIGSS